MRSAVVPSDRVIELPVRRDRPAVKSHEEKQVVLVRLVATSRDCEWLIEAASHGSRPLDFVLAHGGRSMRVELALASVEPSTRRIANGRILINWAAGTISNRSVQLELSRTELRLLSALVENEGRPVSRDILVARAWPDRAKRPEQGRALSVYIHGLRKRLAVVGAKHALKTVRNEGYKLTF